MLQMPVHPKYHYRDAQQTKTKHGTAQNYTPESSSHQKTKTLPSLQKIIPCRQVCKAEDIQNAHFETCYRFENKKIEENRAKTMNRPAKEKFNNQQGSNLQRQEMKQESRMNPQRPESSTKFRIKNVSNASTSYNHSSIYNKSSVNRQGRVEQKVQPIKRQPSGQRVRMNIKDEKKEEMKKYNKREELREEEKREQLKEEEQEKRQEIKREEEKQEMTMFERTSSVQTISEERPAPVIQPTAQQRHSAIIPQQQAYIQANLSQHPREINPPEDPEEAPSTNQRQQVLSLLFISTAQQQEQQAGSSQFQGPNDIQTMLNNSNAIIDFITSTEIMREDQTLCLMVAQLQQLNLIAEQIAQLNQIGRALAFRIGNAFSIRIQEVQSAIINQIGIALLRGFRGRLGNQFNSLAYFYPNINQLQPQISPGFTQEEITSIFQEKLNINQKECSICLQDMKRAQTVIELQCNHTFHPSCIKQWLISSKKCPLCRSVQNKVAM